MPNKDLGNFYSTMVFQNHEPEYPADRPSVIKGILDFVAIILVDPFFFKSHSQPVGASAAIARLAPPPGRARRRLRWNRPPTRRHPDRTRDAASAAIDRPRAAIRSSQRRCLRRDRPSSRRRPDPASLIDCAVVRTRVCAALTLCHDCS